MSSFDKGGNIGRLILSYEYEEDNKVLPVSELLFFVEQRVSGVEILYLPCLASGHDLNLNYEDMADLQRQFSAVDDNNNPVLKTFLSPETSP